MPNDSLTPATHYSSARAPDLDWSQVRETVSMLALSVAQIEATMAEGDDSVSTLSQSFTFIAANVQAWREKQAAAFSSSNLGSTEVENAAVHDLQNEANLIQEQVNHAIVAFQFYDRLTQRLHHVKDSLLQLGELIDDRQRLYNPGAWRELQDTIKSSYTMEAERAMFDAILQGASIEQALATFRASLATSTDTRDDDIELF